MTAEHPAGPPIPADPTQVDWFHRDRVERTPAGHPSADVQLGLSPSEALARGQRIGGGGFVALDFETATSGRDAPCSIGLVAVEGGSVVDTRTWLIRPPGNTFDPYNIFIHGIHPEMTASASSFEQAWPEVAAYLAGRPVVCHWAGFDLSVLRATLARCEMPWPDLDYYCTVVLARRAWPSWLSYSLPFVADQLGIALDHHEAGSDATVAAYAALACIGVAGASTLDAAGAVLGVLGGRLRAGAWRPCSRASSSPAGKSLSKLTPTTDHIDPDNPLYDKAVVFTGTLQSMVRNDAAQLVVNAGGRCPPGVSAKVDYLVFGEQDFSKFVDGVSSSKTKKAEALRAQGATIEVLSERDFLRILDS